MQMQNTGKGLLLKTFSDGRDVQKKNRTALGAKYIAVDFDFFLVRELERAGERFPVV